MARDGSGKYTRAESDYVSGTTISATPVNNELDDIATALSGSIAKDGQTPTTAVIPFVQGISTNTVTERTSGSGVTIDSVLLKDGGVQLGAGGAIVFEGATANDFETTLTVTDPTADRTITLPDASFTITAAGAALIDDADATAQRATLGLVSASQVEMEAGTEAALRSMSPLRVKQAIDALADGGFVKQIVPMFIAAASGTSGIPDDNTSPTSSEGTEAGSQAITLSASSNKVLIQSGFVLGMLAGNRAVATLFRSTTLLATAVMRPGNDGGSTVNFNVIDTPGSTGPHTYSVRVGRGTAGGTWYVAQDSSGNKYNGSIASCGLTLMEYTA